MTETTVATSTVFGFDTDDFVYDDNPYFQLSPRKEDSSLQTPTAAEALKTIRAIVICLIYWNLLKTS